MRTLMHTDTLAEPLGRRGADCNTSEQTSTPIEERVTASVTWDRMVESARSGEPEQSADHLRAVVPPYQPLSEMIRSALRPVGQRLSTGFQTLDGATRGGVPARRLIVLSGAPGAAKTGLATYLADSWERAGCAVVFLAADEPAEGIVTRIGQLAGFSRVGLEADDEAGEAARVEYARRAGGRALVVLDPDDGGARTIEDASDVLEHVAGGRPAVLLVDSIQTARCAAAEGLETPRERMDAKISALKAIAKRGVIVIAISEMSRAGYRLADQNISALAASKESGSIEYAASLLLGLRSVPGETGQIDVEVAKNRLGSEKPTFRLQLDFDRASFREIPRPDDGSEKDARKRRTEEQAAEQACERLCRALRSAATFKSRTDLSRAARGCRADNERAISALLESGTITKVGGAYRLAAEALRGSASGEEGRSPDYPKEPTASEALREAESANLTATASTASEALRRSGSACLTATASTALLPLGKSGLREAVGVGSDEADGQSPASGSYSDLPPPELPAPEPAPAPVERPIGELEQSAPAELPVLAPAARPTNRHAEPPVVPAELEPRASAALEQAASCAPPTNAARAAPEQASATSPHAEPTEVSAALAAGLSADVVANTVDKHLPIDAPEEDVHA